LPKKLPKKKKPTRLGTAYVARRVDGAYLLETRPDSGLLGGMQAWPSTDWSETEIADDAPINAEWKTHTGEVRHTFTHFHLKLRVKTALVPLDRKQTRGEFVEAVDFAPTALPTVMRKVFDLVRSK
jgi:A/G-specific adenine glycosylase